MLKTIKGRLITGVLVLLILLSVTAGVGLNYLWKLESEINVLSDDITPTIEATDDMIASLWEQGKVANEIMASESLEEIKSLYPRFAELDKVYNDSFKELESLLSGEEISFASAAMAANESLTVAIDKMYQAHTDELLEEEKAKSLLDKFDEIGGELIVALDEFALENEEEMAKAEDRGDVLAATVGSTAQEVNDVLGELFERDYPVVEAALKLQRYVIEMQDTAGEYLAEEDASKLGEVRENFDALSIQVLSLMTILDDLAETQEDKDDAVALRANFEKWNRLANEDERLFDSYRDQLEAETAADRYTEELESYIITADAELEKLAGSADAIADSADEAAAEAVLTAVSTLVLVWGSGMAIGVFVTAALLRAITKPIGELLHSLNDIAQGEGDLTQRVNDSGKDEIAGLGRAFNGFVAKIQDLVSQIAVESNSLNQSIGAISEMSGKVSERVEEQSQDVEAVVNAINQVNNAADSITSNARSCSDASRSASTDGESARQVVGQAVASVQGLAGDIDKSASVIDQLNTEVDRIVSVLDVIRDIAEQTNLLALNAAIEAARAGEQGRGFAVVADEVRTLASRTQNSTNEIQGMIESLQRGANDAVQSMNRSKEGGETTVKLAGDAGDALERISAAINNLNQMNEEIATAAAEQRSVVESANQRAQHVQEVVEESRTAAAENLTYTNSMRDSLGRLSSLVGHFKV
ncbi:methyl-accepting chemotaxis protein [Parasalinivibrio latis]|uniref:methyl-accepting chemotaxis protein n=1 Tax=Parasalinivibrio latis TaxID=2952610 RepID=UPI0030E38D5A